MSPEGYLSGNLLHNRQETDALKELLRQYEGPSAISTAMIGGIFHDVVLRRGFRQWTADVSLCGDCLEQLLDDHTYLWLHGKKIKNGWVPPHNCWYGYDCNRANEQRTCCGKKSFVRAAKLIQNIGALVLDAAMVETDGYPFLLLHFAGGSAVNSIDKCKCKHERNCMKAKYIFPAGQKSSVIDGFGALIRHMRWMRISTRTGAALGLDTGTDSGLKALTRTRTRKNPNPNGYGSVPDRPTRGSRL
ncbi:hypothetical protein B0H14DRAFT_2649806 [Mycena olivaceomarginata]|nr:hypothetical protein B0H14DRAFT_2649806 [Mycena olivaceomarginata]